MSGSSLAIAWLGRAGYRAAWDLQERLRHRILDEAGPEILLTLEHDPVITLGRRADPNHVLVDEARLAAAGIERVTSSRGGDVTYHGPGQLVAYPIVRIDSVPAHVEAMAAAVVDMARDLGVEARYRADCPGVWVGNSKLCAFGVHVHRRVAIHGLALNVNTALDAFAFIVPCGLARSGVTSLADLLGDRPPGEEISPARLAAPLARALALRLGRAPHFLAADAIPSLLS